MHMILYMAQIAATLTTSENPEAINIMCMCYLFSILLF